ncbi:substrate of the Dot/Icm secretion system [Legionella waltersii]|uniref:hypothetical protein n=2 Tax=Legionella waltersii TaxID=66969 RepID=UPI000B94C1EB|nr:hypothetical protein [Legionella waltersii]SNV11514.1 substrate of the Dot/Icm secretion system [Legionella waltersii]
MPAPYLNLNGLKIAPFKNPTTQPYGSFANTTPVGTNAKEYRIQQSVSVHGQPLNFNWPSSEHAYHAQKIIHLKNKLPPGDPAQKTLTKMLEEIEATNEEFSPRKHYDGLVNRYLPELNQNKLNVVDKKEFDKLCDADYHAIHNPTGGKKSVDFMRTIIRLKLAQHPDLAKKAIECAKEGVLPVEVSQYDNNWASGPDGKGENMLGILILEEGNNLLEQQGGTPVIPNPQQAYQSLKITQNLSHDNLVGKINPSSPQWVVPSTGEPSVTTTNPLNNQSHQQSSQYYESRGGNQRLMINQNKVIGYEFRQDSSQPWQKSGDPSRFQALVSAFTQQQRVQAPSHQQSSQYYESRGGNQRLVINQNKVVGYEFRQDSNQPWQKSGDPSRFQALVSAFTQQQRVQAPSHQQSSQYYESRGGNQRLVINQNKVVGYEFRQDSNQPWQKSGDPSRFQALVSAFTQQQRVQAPSHQQSSQYYESRGGNQRLVINQNKVVGYEFRQDSNQPWQKSGEHRRFEELVTAFNNRLINELKPYYQAATLDKGRTHLWEAKSFKQQYHALKGDALKTTILNDFKSKIVNCSSRQELEDAVENIRASNDFKILAQAQGLVTHHFNLKTSSVEALERIIEDKFTELRSSSQNSLK